MEWGLIWFASIIAGAFALYPHNKGGNGVLLGLFFGPIGVLIALIWRANLSQARTQREQHLVIDDNGFIKDANRDERDCPYCAERILARAKVCKHCGKDVASV
jgi:hypothetical protein